MIYFIPARKGSKGCPFKNRLLFNNTYNSIPQEYRNSIVVSTDDDWIMNICNTYKIRCIERPEKLSNDTASIKDVLLHYINESGSNEPITLLYLTYPNRIFNDILGAYRFYKKNGAKSLLCKKEVKTHPYLCMYEKFNNKGVQIVKHNFYRRQDYPKCFEISHYIGIFDSSEIINLNDNLYNRNTIFYQIEDQLDVDLPADLNKIKNT